MALSPQKASFWVAVGGTAILANFTLSYTAAKFPNFVGLKRLSDFVNGNGGTA